MNMFPPPFVWPRMSCCGPGLRIKSLGTKITFTATAPASRRSKRSWTAKRDAKSWSPRDEESRKIDHVHQDRAWGRSRVRLCRGGACRWRSQDPAPPLARCGARKACGATLRRIGRPVGHASGMDLRMRGRLWPEPGAAVRYPHLGLRRTMRDRHRLGTIATPQRPLSDPIATALYGSRQFKYWMR